jgi:trehalose/maltose hydrolase-like predicted phosphorylase
VSAAAAFPLARTVLTQPRYKAASYNASYQGAMFPWESAASGEETCPTSAGTGLREIHISGDIAIAVELMYEATGSTSWLASTGFPIASQVAEMWCSRAVPSGDDSLLHINDVIPPDECAPPPSPCRALAVHQE